MPQKAAQKRLIDPESQGMAIGLLAGAVRVGDRQKLMNLVALLLERNVPNLPVLYKVAVRQHPELPAWADLLDEMEDDTSQDETSDEPTTDR